MLELVSVILLGISSVPARSSFALAGDDWHATHNSEVLNRRDHQPAGLVYRRESAEP